MKKFLGHSKEDEVLQQANLSNELANTNGVKSLPHVPATRAKKRNKVL